MAKPLSEYISDVRRTTRILSTVPFDDTTITKFINEAKDYVSSVVPFALVHSYYSSVIGKSVYTLPKDILSILVCKIYPYAGSYLTATLNSTDTEIAVNDKTVFPDNGYIVIGEPPAYEIASYTGKHTSANKLVGLSRGLFGTTAKTWLYDPTAYTPVRSWERGAKWLTVAPQTDVTAADENEWIYTPQDLQQSKTAPTAFGIRGGALVFDKPFYVNGFANIVLHCLITPPDLVNATDTVYGLPDAFEKVITLAASQMLLKALGGEDSMVRYQTLDEEFKVLLQRLNNYIENTVRGTYGAIAVETYRSGSPTSRGRRQ